MTQLDMFTTATEARDAALAQVAANASDWMTEARSVLNHCPLRGQVTGGDIRLWVTEIVGHPHHHNAWGALISWAIKRNILVPTGASVAMKTPKSHARKTPTYWVTT